ncbi:MAG: preprotein translocase subunit SecA [Candidatus Nealsonbacteria bacterium]|nr:preprotein translocase subunit SecA [Candidatus Nealsonbacteria bacterium]
MSIFNKILGDANEKYLRKIQSLIGKINSFEPVFEKFSNTQLKAKTQEFKEKIVGGSPLHNLDEVLPEAFALVREAAKRTLNQRHFDVQLIGGIILHQGKIAEMRTGEGKTLAATLPLYLNALEGKGAHLVTINDYLSKRDAVWMGQIYHALGLSVGCITHEAAYLYDSDYSGQSSGGYGNEARIVKGQTSDVTAKRNGYRDQQTLNDNKDKERDTLGGFKVVESYLRPVARKEAYLADIVYGTNNEFGFDYLKDNLVYDLKDQVQREFTQLNNFAKGEIAAKQHLTGLNYAIVDEVDSILIDEARTPLIISAPGEESTEKYYQFAKIVARLKEKDDYEIDEKLKAATFTEAGQNKIVRLLGRDPWQENDIATTHQLEAALRAKTLFQRDRDYVVKDGEIIIVDEFTGRLMPGRRWSAGLHQAVEAREGVNVQKESRTFATITFQNYFRLYRKLSGMTGTAVTSAEEFDKVYGLDVIVTPTNKPMVRQDLSDRIYKTLGAKFKAVAGEIKQRHQKGQPVLVGTVSIEKNEYLGRLLDREGIPHQILNAKHHEKEGEIIAQAGKLGAVTIATNMAGRGVDIILGGNPPNLEEQKKVLDSGGLHIIGTERHEARRIDNQLRGRAGRQGDAGSSQFFVSLEDDLMRIFGGDRIKSLMETFKIPEDQPIEVKMISKAIESAQSKVEGMNFDLRKHILEYDDVMNKHREIFYKKRRSFLEISNHNNQLRNYILDIVKKAGFTEEDYLKKEKEAGEDTMRQIEKFICLRVLDSLWLEHLENMEYLRDSVRLRAYGQQDPLVEYKREGHRMFKKLLENIDSTIANAVLSFHQGPTLAKTPPRSDLGQPGQPGQPGQTRQSRQKVGRNDPCLCGSGKKYKKCCGGSL